jgi:hypothetical protein
MTPRQEFEVLSKRASYLGGRKGRSAERRLECLIGGSFTWTLGRAFGMTFMPLWTRLTLMLGATQQPSDGQEKKA